MNSQKKGKKKKIHRIIPYREEGHKDQEQIATQNLFIVSHFEDEDKRNTFQKQANMLQSVTLEQKGSISSISTSKRKNIIRFAQQKKKDDPQKSQLEKYMDKQFIQESKVLLKLYSTMPDQNDLISPKIRSKNASNSIKSKNSSSMFTSLKSDLVFVAKTRKIQQNSVQKHKRRLQVLVSPQKMKDEKIQRRLNLLTQSILKKTKLYTRHKDYFSINQPRNNINRSKSPQFQHLKQKFSQYRRIKRLKTLNHIHCDFFNDKKQEQNVSKDYLQTQNSRQIEQKIEQKNRNRERFNRTIKNAAKETFTNTFRKRHTFYRSQKQTNNKVNVIRL